VLRAKGMSKEQKAAHLAEHEKSGLSGAKYAASKGLNVSSFYNWLSNKNRKKVPKPVVSNSGFVKVKIGGLHNPHLKHSEAICLKLTSGQMLEFPSSVSPQYLAQFVRALN